MPDVPNRRGLAEGKKIANLAEMHYLPFAPHLVSTPLGTIATCHQCAAVPNFLVLEWHALDAVGIAGDDLDDVLNAFGDAFSSAAVSLSRSPVRV